MRALIVDDSRFVRDSLRGMPEDKGIECEEATDGGAAMMRLHEAEPFDLALVDWNMPVMDGLPLLKTLRSESYSKIKGMMVTTQAGNDSILCVLDAGADEYLMKPFDKHALNEKLAILGLVEA